MKPKVSIIMIVYDQRKDWFMTALDSAYKQTYENTEVIVSTIEGDPAAEWAKIFPGVKVVTGTVPDAKGQLNTGIRFCTGDYVVVLASDDFYYPNAIKVMMDTAIEKDSVMVYSDLHHADQDLNIVMIQEAPREFDYNKLEQLQFMCDSTLVKKSVLEEFGLYQTKWRKFAMWVMWLQIGKKYPDRIHHTKTVLCKYRRHDKSLSLKAYHGEKKETGEGLRQAFNEEFNIRPVPKSTFKNNKVVTIYAE